MKKRRRGDRKVHFQCRVSGKSFGLSAADCSLLETVEEIRIETSPGESKLDEWIRCLARWIIIEPVMLRGLGASLFSMRFFPIVSRPISLLASLEPTLRLNSRKSERSYDNFTNATLHSTRSCETKRKRGWELYKFRVYYINIECGRYVRSSVNED